MFGIGIDVSKATLDVAVHGEQFRQFSNDKRGFVRLIRWLKTWPIKQVVLEASGGYERAALDVLHAAGLPMVRINPARARRFAQGTGRAAKTDRIDAMVLAQMVPIGTSASTSRRRCRSSRAGSDLPLSRGRVLPEGERGWSRRCSWF